MTLFCDFVFGGMKKKYIALTFFYWFCLLSNIRHIWGYLRIVLTNLNRLDLTELSGQENLKDLVNALKMENLIDPL